MDRPQELTHLSLCAGYGGIDIGLKRVFRDLRTVAYSEIEGFAGANLVAKMEACLLDAAPIWTDLKTFPWESFRDRIHIMSGGYPCQPFSAAGKRRGKDDPRHLWPHIRRGIEIVRPKICFFENVEGHISLGLREVLSDLAALGYKVEGPGGEPTWGIFSAAEVGTPHQRKRVFILAVAEDWSERFEDWISAPPTRIEGQAAESGNYRQAWPNGRGMPQQSWEPPRTVAHPDRLLGVEGSGIEGQQWNSTTGTPSELGHTPGLDKRRMSECQCDGQGIQAGGSGCHVADDNSFREQQPSGQHEQKRRRAGHGSATLEHPQDIGCERQPSAGRETSTRPQHANTRTSAKRKETPQPQMGGDAHGSPCRMDYATLCHTTPDRVDELRLLGNGVVPDTAERAARTLANRMI